MNRHPKCKDAQALSADDQAADQLTKDADYPAAISEKQRETSLYQDVERKKEEINNSTVGGF